MPEISVIIPVYNTEKYLCECIESILSQSFKDFELILVDDGSTDDSGKLCDNYSEKYSFITVLHQKNMGQSAARNAGVKESCADILCFIDSDDIAHPDMLKSMYSVFNDSDAGAVTCERVRGTDPSEDFFSPVDINPEQIEVNENSLLKLLQENNTVYWTLFPCLITKAIYEKYPLEPGRIMEDNAVTCKWLVESGSVAIIHPPLYFYRENPNGTMNSAFSVKKLDFLWALNEQICFYKSLGYNKLRGRVSREYVLNALWFAKRAENELDDKRLAKKLTRDALKTQRNNSDCVSLTVAEKRKLFKACHPFLYRVRKRFHR